MKVVTAKDPAESIVLSISFVNLLAPGETIQACVFSCQVASGAVDLTPAAMISGAADFSGAPICLQRVIGGVAGTTYLISAKVTTSLANILVGTVQLPVVNGGA